MNIFRLVTGFSISIIFTTGALAKNYYVDGNKGSDKNAGTLSAPFKTIQKAAAILVAGDTCYIHGAIYRELVQPLNGGESENKRIVYKAYPGETPILCGSEKIISWVAQGANIYKVTIPNSFFGKNNLFAENVYDPNGWLLYGSKFHMGAVYINGESYFEKFGQKEVASTPKSFYATVNKLTTTITINYSGSKNPNADLSEISVRPTVIKPKHRGKCNYITLDGLAIRHGATNWSSNEGVFSGMIDLNACGWWTIKNCHISDGRTCGIQAGMSPGHHLITNNLIERFGQAGLVGNNGGWSASLVKNNIFQDINVRYEIGGAETAAFKTHNTFDLTIQNNIFRRINVYDSAWGFAIWLDWRCQGNRITGNIFSELRTLSAIEVECSHGPTLIDNNIFHITSDTPYAIKHNSSNTIVAHNLFINAANGHYTTNRNNIGIYKPHTNAIVRKDTVAIINDKYYNNVFIGGNNNIPQRPGYQCDYNAYLQGALKSSWADANSYPNPAFMANVQVKNDDSCTTVSFNVDDGTALLQCPVITNSMIGICPPTNQGMENNDGSPIDVNTDIMGQVRSGNPKVGPIESIHTGVNTITLVAGIKKGIQK
jgi:alpha-L-arabinofuranosidase